MPNGTDACQSQRLRFQKQFFFSLQWNLSSCDVGVSRQLSESMSQCALILVVRNVKRLFAANANSDSLATDIRTNYKCQVSSISRNNTFLNSQHPTINTHQVMMSADLFEN
jgi:hypothetical protein